MWQEWKGVGMKEAKVRVRVKNVVLCESEKGLEKS